MTTAVLPSPTAVSWSAAGARGPRRHHADATAGFTGRGASAVALADGVGDSPAAREAAQLVADHAVRAAVLEGRADAGLAAAHDLLMSATPLVSGDAAAVVAASPQRHSVAPGIWTLAWVGDCRAYRFDGTALHPLTRDQTVAEEMRALGVRVHPRFEHVLTASARTADPRTIRVTTVASPGTLLLVSDGVHRALPASALAALLARGASSDAAERIVAAATRAGTRDNATALVLEVPAT